MNSEERRTYVREVCLALVGKEPEDTRMSNAEVTQISDWARQGVPLRVVLQVIEQLRDARREGELRSLFETVLHKVLYIKPAVEQELQRRDRALA